MPVLFQLDNEYTDTVSGWFGRRKGTGARSGLGSARAYAMKNGVAVVMLGDDSACLFYRSSDTGIIRKKEYPADEVTWEKSSEGEA